MLLEQLGQAHATAINLVLGQLKMGLTSEHCCMALLLANGQLYQFGFVALLYPSFPVDHQASLVIDTADSHVMRTAADGDGLDDDDHEYLYALRDAYLPEAASAICAATSLISCAPFPS